MDPICSSTTFKISTWEAPTISISESQQGWHPQDPQEYRKQRNNSQQAHKDLLWLSFQGSEVRKQTKIPHFSLNVAYLNILKAVV